MRDTLIWQIIYFVATFTGMLCVVLTSGKRWFQWIVGLVNIVGFVLLYWHWQLYGNFALNLLFYIPASIIGIITWLKNRDTKYTSKVKTLTNKNKIVVLVISVVALVIIAVPLSYLDKGANQAITLIGFLDSVGMVLGVIGQILLNLRYTEQWWIWIILDVVMAILNFVIGQYAMGVMYLLWTTNAIIGLIVWQKSASQSKENASD
jgi:nicotinamide mononucleotide transporter